MRQIIKDFVSIAAASFSIKGPIYEFGSLLVSGQEDLANLRPLFRGYEYVGADIREGLGVDKILDLHKINLPSESVGTILCLDTLEHVEYPHRALEEMHRVLSPNGIAVISSVMCFPIHDYPNDYWRFTPEAFKSILKPFSSSFIGYAGKHNFPHSVVGIGFKGFVPDLTEFMVSYKSWRKREERVSLRSIIKLITPPLLISLLSRCIQGTKRLGGRQK